MEKILEWEECSPARTPLGNFERHYESDEMDIALAVKMLEDLNEEIGEDNEAFGQILDESGKCLGHVAIKWEGSWSRHHIYTPLGGQPLTVHVDYL